MFYSMCCNKLRNLFVKFTDGFNLLLFLPVLGYGMMPSPPEYIMGAGLMSRGNLVSFFMENNPSADRECVDILAGMYIEECAAEGVNSDVAFVQMCLETGFLRFQGLVTADMNNFCGLGATGPEDPA